MRITKRQLKRIIREEHARMLEENKLRRLIRHRLLRETEEEGDDEGGDEGGEEESERSEPPEIEIKDPGRIRGHGRK